MNTREIHSLKNRSESPKIDFLILIYFLRNLMVGLLLLAAEECK